MRNRWHPYIGGTAKFGWECSKIEDITIPILQLYRTIFSGTNKVLLYTLVDVYYYLPLSLYCPSLSSPAMIRIESEDLTSNVVLASFGTSLTIQCFGSGNLVWTTPPNQTVFTSYDPSRNVLTLSIPNFITPARYTCSSDLLAGLEKTILITTDGMVLANVALYMSL